MILKKLKEYLETKKLVLQESMFLSSAIVRLTSMLQLMIG